ncbi:hypothetical protein AVEN_131123-1 [Araneus ventricosus]|uniref:Uncharacterized protein n=1 Tax=Araneus ventricosus TaxID=182803 RepID=A0A4Y2DJ79_ARAVE|nr:hypothetical protein AVEN_131123-1 [Araneus ventricosus]
MCVILTIQLRYFQYLTDFPIRYIGRSGLVVRSQFGAGAFLVRNPIPLKTCRVLGLLHVKSYVGDQTSSRWCDAEVWTGGGRPRHLTAVQNYEVRPQIALVLLQKWDVN